MLVVVNLGVLFTLSQELFFFYLNGLPVRKQVMQIRLIKRVGKLRNKLIQSSSDKPVSEGDELALDSCHCIFGFVIMYVFKFPK